MSSTILIIEDSPHNMEIVTMILQSMGYKTLEASDGIAGLDMIAKHKPDVVLIDYHLPGLDGLDVVRTLKESEELHHIPIIALTADIYIKDKFLEAGCAAYIAKPIRRGSLLRTIQHVLEPLPSTNLNSGTN